jgi:hypothetical protein
MKFSKLSLNIIIFLLFQTIGIAQTTFIERQQITTDFSWRTPNNISAADLDGDNDKDVLVANFRAAPLDDNQIMWFKNIGSAGTFGNPIYIQCENFRSMTAIHAADLDGDGDMDFIVSDDSQQIAWFENIDGHGNFSAQKFLRIHHGIRTVSEPLILTLMAIWIS